MNQICAGIVLFNPEIERLKLNIKSALMQFNRIFLVDNGSENIEIISTLYGKNSAIKLVKNMYNMGIAKALNQILDLATEENFSWCVTLDQDSIMQVKYVENLQNDILISNVGLICPDVIDINLNNAVTKNGIVEVFNPSLVITSGSCINVKIAKIVGMFDEKLFIDYVDIDFNERILKSGFKIIRDYNISLYHEIGKSEYKYLLGKKILVDHHNAIRRYYITRNRLYYKKRYFGKKEYIIELLKIPMTMIKVLFYESDKKEKMKAIIKGVRDSRGM